MYFGKIIGTVVAPQKDESLVGSKLLILRQADPGGAEAGLPFVAVDTVGAGVGELVLYVTGSVAPFAVRKNGVPIDSAVVAIVEHVEWQKS